MRTIYLILLCLIASVGRLQSQLPYLPANYSSGVKVNYVRTWDAKKPESDANNITISAAVRDFQMTTQYLDGLGRPIQKVIKQGSIATGGTASDLVMAQVYDELGREQYSFLPSPANSTGSNTSINDGLFKLNPFEQQASAYSSSNPLSPIAGQGEYYFYGQNKFEASPLNRVTETFAPGNSWVGTAGEVLEANRRSVKTKYYTNTANDLVRIWNVTNNATIGEWGTISTPTGDTGYYQAGELFKTITVDEHGKQVIEFKNKSGQVILKKVQLTATADDGSGRGYDGWICTYYIYDDLGNLRTVIQPNSVNNIYSTWVIPENNFAQLCFKYEYDERNRMIRKHVPGAQDMYYVYDARSRLVMFRDGNMRYDGKWLITKYDSLNRPIETGIWNNTGNPAFHRAAASSSINYPSPPSNYDLLSTTHYDDYDDLPVGLTTSLDNSWSDEFIAGNNVAPLYAQELVATSQLRGLVAWTKRKVVGDSGYIYTVILYDNKGRVIQNKSTNITGGQDIITTQYNWSGQPLIMVSYTNIGGSSVQHITQVTRMGYDDLARLVKIEKKTANGITPGGSLSSVAFTTVVEHTYDAIGNLKDKTIGSRKDPATGQYYGLRQPLDTLRYDYNIRGWQLGMNRIMAKGGNTNNYFGYDIGYNDDKIQLPGQPQIGNYSNPAFNGNIGGITWKSIGDGEIRKYDYVYDQANRLLRADFTQYGSGSSWSNTEVDFTVKMGDGANGGTAYDNNGNIRRMRQWGLTLSGSRLIDSLAYIYYGNVLKSVTEVSSTIGSTDFHLGDFTDKNRIGDDYGYDQSGNLVTDKNKNIIGNTGSYQGTSEPIRYNHLNLPSQITVHTDSTGNTVKGTINYLYTAEGAKLEKRVTEQNASVFYGDSNYTSQAVSITRYINGLVLESKSYSNITLDTALGYTDRLQFGAQEEGRVRAVFSTADPNAFDHFEYDYMIKDHLGNVRMLLTEQVKADTYPAATMETAQAATENTFYSNLDATRSDKPSGYPSDPTTDPNDKAAKVRGDGNKIGPAILLKVMAGDKINLKVNSWWNSGSSPVNSPNPLAEVASALAGSIGNLAGGKYTSVQLTSSGLPLSAADAFLDNQGYISGKPKAYINCILLDEQFKAVITNDGKNSWTEQVAGSGVWGDHHITDWELTKNGYLYIYTSNVTENIDVFFDNLQVTHIRGPLLEETHYYPWGLTMAGISSKALEFGNPENKKKFNGGTELNTDFNINLYETAFRGYDPQIGRFHQIDKWAEITDSWSPYVFASNNPILRNDPLGLTDTIVNGEKGETKSLENVTVTNTRQKRPDYSALSANTKTANALPLPLGPTLATGGSQGGVWGIIGAGLLYAGIQVVYGPTMEETLQELYMKEREALQRWAEITVASIETTLAYLEQFGGGKETLYELYTTTPGLYPYLKSGRFWKMYEIGEIQLPANATWKYGTTKQNNIIGGAGKYPARYSPGQVPGLESQNLYTGTRLQVYAMQAYFIAAYFLKHGDLPPGNKGNW